MQNQLQQPEVDSEFRQALASACRMLAIREHTEKQIRQKLLSKGFSFEVLEPCIDYLVKENWLCEKRYCNLFIRSKAAKGQGKKRIIHELKKQAVDWLIIEQALVVEAIDWQKNCHDTLAKKIRLSFDSPSDFTQRDLCNQAQQGETLASLPLKERLKLERFLRYRGFSDQQIRQSINDYLSNSRSFER